MPVEATLVKLKTEKLPGIEYKLYGKLERTVFAVRHTLLYDGKVLWSRTCQGIESSKFGQEGEEQHVSLSDDKQILHVKITTHIETPFSGPGWREESKAQTFRVERLLKASQHKL